VTCEGVKAPLVEFEIGVAVAASLVTIAQESVGRGTHSQKTLLGSTFINFRRNIRPLFAV